MDSAVHFVAALRTVAAASGLGEPLRVGARATSRCGPGNDLPSPDTLTGWVEYSRSGTGGGKGGKSTAANNSTTTTGTLSVTFAGATPRFALTLDTRSGAVELSRGGYGGTATGRGAGYTVAVSSEAETETAFYAFGGLEAELESFLRLARGQGNEEDARALSPASAARDLSLIEAALLSSKGGGAPVEVVPLEVWEGLDPLEDGFGVAGSL